MALGGFRIGAVRGIPIRVHFTFLLILPVLAFAFARAFREAARVADIPPDQLFGFPWVWGLGMALALFGSVLLHELAHSLYALRVGGRVRDITLLMIGGVSQLTEAPKESRHEAIMALVGPLTSLGIGGALLGINAALDFSLFNVRFALFYLGALNVVLGVFNLLPAFPMDGGRILRAVMTPRLGVVRATRRAASIGKGFAVVFGLLGLVSFNLILMLIAFFIYLGAEGESRQVQLKHALEGLRVRDVMRTEPVELRGEQTVEEAVARLVLERRHTAVVDRGDGTLGITTLRLLEKIPAGKRRTVQLAQLAPEASVVEADEPASRALQLLAESRIGRLLVKSAGQLLGTISQEDLLRTLKLRELESTEAERVGWGEREQQV